MTSLNNKPIFSSKSVLKSSIKKGLNQQDQSPKVMEEAKSEKTDFTNRA